MKHTPPKGSSTGSAGSRDEQVYSITSASEGHSDELGSRELRYALSMGVRTLCFIGAVIAWNHAMWLAIVLLVGAVFLPYTSVILANAGVRTKGEGTDIMKPEPFGQISDRPAEERRAERD
ncbi:DUF3099 domain-containing protein [Aeromicrobium sp.]|uniref:DUF3099 domain-containing protein n=1 Tax=Aeromicrobium sp. TaxID=1871063 RepID=UPI003512F13A